MVFSSNIFLFLFLPLILALYFAVPKNLFGKKYENYLLLAASLIFYAWGELPYLWLLGLSILGNYWFGILIFRQRQNLQKFDFSKQDLQTLNHQKSLFQNSFTKGEISENSACKDMSFQRKLESRVSFKKFSIIFLALTFNLVLLAYFKYANFFAQNLALLFDNPSLINKNLLPHHLPIGISFFTFHAISYLIDIYRGKCKAQKNLLDLSLYIAFFPQLIAGPIVRYNAIEKYLHQRRQSLSSASYGIRRFLIGFAKKIIIANPLGEVADAIFSSQLDMLDTRLAWIGIICYSMQIYFDFSGYSDMAVGLARIFGFKFPENFNYPYVSRSIKEFWRRWHMSLSAWFRDYVYIPLGGNRVSLIRQYFNLVLVFFLCGLWHGASWNFIIWGLFHGCFLVFERIKIGQNFLQLLPNFLQHFYAIFIVMIGWVFFRSPDLTYATGYLNLMFSKTSQLIIPNNIASLINSHFVMTAFALSLLGFGPYLKDFCAALIKKNKIFLWIFDVALISTFIFAILRLSASTHNPFIYFQF